MAHPEVKVGETFSFENPNGKRTRLIGKVTALKDGVATVYAEGKYRHLDASTARKVRTRKVRRVRRAIQRGEL